MPRIPDRVARAAVPLAFAATAAAATITGARHQRTAATVTKPLPMLILAGLAGRGWRSRSGTDNALLAGSLAFSFAGDRAMLLEEFADDEPTSEGHLRIGASLFAGAQLCYIAALRRRGARPRPARVVPRSALMAESALLVAANRPALLPILGPYGAALGTMSALASDVTVPQPRLRAGGWLFLLSDLTIMNRRFLLDDPRARQIAEAWVLASYFVAQWLLVTGLTRSPAAE